jgi:hypothetical protein
MTPRAEADQHVSGIACIQTLMTTLAGLTDASGAALTDRATTSPRRAAR